MQGEFNSNRNHNIGIHWFRRDLRIQDNPALMQAVENHDQILPIYIDNTQTTYITPGSASRWWIRSSLVHLYNDFSGSLCIFNGKVFDILSYICTNSNIKHVYCNRVYDPISRQEELHLASSLSKIGVTLHVIDDQLLDLESLVSNDASKIFTAFHRQVFKKNEFAPVLKPYTIPKPYYLMHQPLEFNFDYSGPDFNFIGLILPGESKANLALEYFLISNLKDYTEFRNRPDMDVTSKLSPYLAWGNISTRKCFALARAKGEKSDEFLRQIIWSEFTRYMLRINPHMINTNLKQEFDLHQWKFNNTAFTRWKEGKTGYAMVDAAMIKLNREGFISNRLRLIVASFLVHNLRIQWQHGERWFWDKLIDAQIANNAFNWQWVSGAGNNGIIRILNPSLQLAKYDPWLTLLSIYLPELKHLTLEDLKKPYITPVVDLINSRKDAMHELSKTLKRKIRMDI